jgi:hypothetical protein
MTEEKINDVIYEAFRGVEDFGVVLREIGYNRCDELSEEFPEAVARVYGTLLTDAYRRVNAALDEIQEHIGEIKIKAVKKNNSLGHMGEDFTEYKIMEASIKKPANERV